MSRQEKQRMIQQSQGKGTQQKIQINKALHDKRVKNIINLVHNTYGVDQGDKLDQKNTWMQQKKWFNQFSNASKDSGFNQGISGDHQHVQNTLMQMQDNYIKTKYEQFQKLVDTTKKSNFLERLSTASEVKTRVNRICRHKTPTPKDFNGVSL